MATDPIFAATVNQGAAVVSATADTSMTAPTQSVTVVTGATLGSKVEELTFIGTGTTLAGLINVFLYDGTTYHLYDQVAVTAVTSSTTAAAFRQQRFYQNLWVKTGWFLKVTSTVASQLISVTAQFADF